MSARDDVGERRGHRVHEVPRLALVPADVETAVVADHDVLRVLRIDPDRVLIDVAGLAVAAGLVERRERLAAVERLRDRQARDVDRLVVRRIDAELAEVHRPRVAVADERPGLALVLRAEDAAARADRAPAASQPRRRLLRAVRRRRHRRLNPRAGPALLHQSNDTAASASATAAACRAAAPPARPRRACLRPPARPASPPLRRQASLRSRRGCVGVVRAGVPVSPASICA